MKSPQRSRLLTPDRDPKAPARRIDQRHALALPLTIVADGVAIEAESLDAGFGGMCIRADIAHARGCEVTLRVAFGGVIGAVDFSAEVIWRDGRRAGLRFTRVQPLQLWALSRVLPDGRP